MSNQALYPYTLKPVALAMSETEFKEAQLALFEKTSQSQKLMQPRPKEWAIIAVLVVSAFLGIVFVSGYSKILFWLILVGVVVYLLIRTLGLKWYLQKEYQKQAESVQLPPEMKNLSLGVQAHGLIMSMPAPQTQAPKGMALRVPATQQAIIAWDKVSAWDETEKFLFIMFEVQGQKGSQIIPKRLDGVLPISTIIKHLKQQKTQGLDISAMQSKS